jgi:hypothetical protein
MSHPGFIQDLTRLGCIQDKSRTNMVRVVAFRFVNKNYAEEMSTVLRFTNPWVTKQMEPEYAAAMAKFDCYMYSVDEVAQVVVVKGNHSHTVHLLDWGCDCSFAATMKLPCRHAVAWRKNQGRGAIIPLNVHDSFYRDVDGLVLQLQSPLLRSSSTTRLTTLPGLTRFLKP